MTTLSENEIADVLREAQSELMLIDAGGDYDLRGVIARLEQAIIRLHNEKGKNMIEHEQLLARALAIRRSQIKPDVFDGLVNRIADIRALDNPTFDRWEFIEICHGRRAQHEE